MVTPCWVLIVTRGLTVWLPPEVYLHRRDLAQREMARWREILHIPTEPPEFSPRARVLHLVRASFPEPWRAGPVWVGVRWSVRSYPRLKIELMAADEQGAADWLRQRVPKKLSLQSPGEIEFERRGVPTSVGVFRVKRVSGF